MGKNRDEILKLIADQSKELAQGITQMNQKLQKQFPEFNIVQSVKELQKRLITDQSKEIVQGITQMNQKLQKQFPEFNIVQPFKELQKQLHALEPFVKAWFPFPKVVKEIMLETGWWICPSLMEIPLKWISKAIVNYKNGEKNAITNLFKKVYYGNNYQHLKETVEGWNKNLFFKQRSNIINDALEAHCKEKYTLSIPVLLATAEGISIEYCKKMGIKGGESKEKIKKALKLARIEEKVLAPEALYFAITEKIFQSINRLKKEKSYYERILNRHTIMHGLQTNYGTSENSLKCFMLLDAINILII